MTDTTLDASASKIKHCPKCEQDKPATTEFFCRQKLGKYGLTSRCKICASAEAKERARLRLETWQPSGLPKTCSKCSKTHSATLDNFGFNAGCADGLQPECRKCKLARQKKKYIANPEFYRAKMKADIVGNRRRGREYREKWRAINRSKVRVMAEAVRKCPGCGKSHPLTSEFFHKRVHHRSGFSSKCKPCENAKNRAMRSKKPEYYRQYEAARTVRRRTDPTERLHTRVGNEVRAWARLTRTGKRSSWTKILGYDAEQLRTHLERQFSKGIDWAGYGTKWHIDHIIPLKSFDIKGIDDKEFAAAWAISNLRPLLSKKNLTKGGNRTLLL